MFFFYAGRTLVVLPRVSPGEQSKLRELGLTVRGISVPFLDNLAANADGTFGEVSDSLFNLSPKWTGAFICITLVI